jgi:hypothetical protein
VNLEGQSAPSADTPNPAPVPDGTAAEPAVDANPADSSVADTPDANVAPVSLLSVVQSAVEKKEEAPAGSSDAKGEGEAAVAADGGAKPEGEAAAEGEAEADVPFHNHPRWKQLKEERDAFKVDAENYRDIQEFVQANGLTGDEVAEGYEVMALLKRGDRESLTKALEWFEPRVDFLREQIGAVLPDDIRERVESGELDEETANELAQARAAVRLNERADADRTKRETEANAAANAETAALDMAKAVQAWEDQTKAADPDYAKKAELVIINSRAIIQERGGKFPANQQEAVELAKAAYQRVNDTFKALIPTPKAVTPSPAGSSVPQPRPVATSLRGAIEAALQN